MYILFGDSGNVEAAIPHGQQVRQGNNVDIYVCFPYEDKYKTAKPILSYNKGTEWIDMQNIVPSSNSPYPFVFTRDYVDEAIFGFELNKEYWCYHFSVIRETGFTEKFGIVQLQIRVSDENGEYNFLGIINVNVAKTYGNSSTGVSMSNYLNLLKKVESIQENLEGAAFLAKDNIFLGTNTFKKHIEIAETYDGVSVLDLTKAKFYNDGIRLEYGSSIYFIAFPNRKAGTLALEEDIPSIEGLAKIEYVDAQDEATLNNAKEYTDEKIGKIDHSAYAKLNEANTFTETNTFKKGVSFVENNAKLTGNGLYSDSGNLFYPTFTIRGDASGAFFAYAYQSGDADLTLYAKKAYVDGTFATKDSLSGYATIAFAEGKLSESIAYTDRKIEELNAADFASLSKNNAFTANNDFQGEVTIKEATKDNNPSTKGYVDRKTAALATQEALNAETSARESGDTATLNNAKEYTDTAINNANLSDFASKSKANTFTSENTFNESVVIKKNLTVNGTFTKVNAETISTKEYTIGLAKGNTAPIASYVGMYAEKYDGTNDGALVWDNTGTAYVGDVTIDENGKITDGSNLQPLLTREEATSFADKAILFWSADGSKATQGKDSSGTVYTLDYLANIVGKFGDYLPLSGGTASGDIASTNGTNDTTLSHNGVISHVDGYQHDVRFSSQGIWATDNNFAYSFAYGVTGTIAYADTADNANLSLYAKKTELPSTANCVKYVTNTVDVGGTEKAVSTVSPSTIFVPSGLIMGGSAQQAGLMTRGISGSTTPDGSSGACSKDVLYVNFDGVNTYARELVLGAGSRGSAITVSTAKSTVPSSLMGNAFSAIRGDQMVNYVRDYVASATSSFAKNSGNNTFTGINEFRGDFTFGVAHSKCMYPTYGHDGFGFVDDNIDSGVFLFPIDHSFGTEEKYLVYSDTLSGADVSTKQDKLVSGTNIKTINGQSLLGEGNIAIEGGGGGDVTSNGDNLFTGENVFGNGKPTYFFNNSFQGIGIQNQFDFSGKDTTIFASATGGSHPTHDYDIINAGLSRFSGSFGNLPYYGIEVLGGSNIGRGFDVTYVKNDGVNWDDPTVNLFGFINGICPSATLPFVFSIGGLSVTSSGTYIAKNSIVSLNGEWYLTGDKSQTALEFDKLSGNVLSNKLSHVITEKDFKIYSAFFRLEGAKPVNSPYTGYEFRARINFMSLRKMTTIADCVQFFNESSCSYTISGSCNNSGKTYICHDIDGISQTNSSYVSIVIAMANPSGGLVEYQFDFKTSDLNFNYFALETY